jgi:TolA-binding protein
MRIISRWIAAFGIILAIHPPAWAQSTAPPVAPPAWPVTAAPARFVIDPDEEGPPRLMSWVDLCLPDPKWETMTIRVFTDTGIAVGSDLLWTAPGEPATLLFDSSSGAKHYQVYVGSDWPALHLPDGKAGVRMESREGDGTIIKSLPEMLQAWNQSGKVVGRAIVPGIDEGGNRFGPQVNLFEHLQGWFDVAVPEHLQIAVISVDSSFVLLDGKEIVEWPGNHGWGTGPAGPPQAAVDLAAGLHFLDYYNAYVPSAHTGPLMCALAMKGGSFDQWTLLRGDSNFFRPAGHAHVVSYELQAESPGASAPGAAPALAIDWTFKEQSVIFTDIADVGLISMQLTCLVPSTGTLTWTFDDGSTAEGPSVTHLFPRPGMRTVHLSLKEGDKPAASLTQTIRVHMDWAHPDPQGPQLYPEHEADIMGRDPATLPASDLAGCVALLGGYEKSDDLLKFVPALCAKMNEISETDLPCVKDAALLLVHEDWTDDAEESRLLRALIDRSTQANASPMLLAVAGECRLALARLVLKTSDQTDEARSLLDAIHVSTLSGDDPRALAILRADLALATGDVAGAKKQYETLTGAPSGPDARSSIRRTARIGQARAFLDRKDCAAAEDALNEVAWQFPIEKMSPDWALTRLRLDQEENLPVAAYLWAKRLLPVVTESGRSELLFRLTDLALAQGDGDLARKTLSELLRKHPYSQEAAEAKEKWPGQE